MKKNNNPARRAKKIILLRFCPEKISWPGPKTQAPTPPPPEYQMDRALYEVFPTRCSMIYKVVVNIKRVFLIPPQKRQGPDYRFSNQSQSKNLDGV